MKNKTGCDVELETKLSVAQFSGSFCSMHYAWLGWLSGDVENKMLGNENGETLNMVADRIKLVETLS